MIVKMKFDKILGKIYYDPLRGFSSVNKLTRDAQKLNKDISNVEVKNFLDRQLVYTLHRYAGKKYVRNKVFVSGIDEQWQADLVDLQSLEKYNDGYKYLMTCIDLFSKLAWAIPLKSKVSENIKNAFSEIFKTGRKPEKLQTDAGTEFVNKQVQKFLKNENVEFFTTNSEMKASVVERFNRTLKEKMWKYFTYKNTYRYLDVLPELLKNYNTSYHRTIKMAPLQVNSTNERKILNKVFRLSDKTPVFKFSVGDFVRISKVKRTFEKGYTPNWTEEIFKITHRLSRTPPVYRICDLKDEEISGIFYEQELLKIDKKPPVRVIENVLKTRKIKGKTDYFVKYRGYPPKFNEWVSSITRR